MQLVLWCQGPLLRIYSITTIVRFYSFKGGLQYRSLPSIVCQLYHCLSIEESSNVGCANVLRDVLYVVPFFHHETVLMIPVET